MKPTDPTGVYGADLIKDPRVMAESSRAEDRDWYLVLLRGRSSGISVRYMRDREVPSHKEGLAGLEDR